MQNREVAHRFFYDLNGSFDRRSMTVSYYNDCYFSYGTCIGEISETITGKTVLLVSDNNFSNTTSKHIRELINACPFEYRPLPQRMYQRDFNAFNILGYLKSNLEYYSKSRLSRQENRQGFLRAYNQLIDCLELVKFSDYISEINKLMDDYKELKEQIKNNVAELKAKQKQRDIEKRNKLKAELAEILEKTSYLERIQYSYDYNLRDYITSENRQKLKQLINPKNDLSFIWFNGEKVNTSQGITVNKIDVIKLLKLWEHNKDILGLKIDNYTILEKTSDYVKVGCHKIPVENLKALLNVIKAEKTVA